MATQSIVMQFRESTGPIDTPWGCELKRIEKRISDSDTAGIRARWESGRHILSRRIGKQLPKGLLKDICKGLGVSQKDVSLRVMFAEAFPTEQELSNAVTKFVTWKEIITKALPSKRTRAAARQPVMRATVVRGVVVQCRQFHSTKDIPTRVVTDLQALYAELQRLFAKEP